jgi:hypothetical protein
MTWIGKDGHIHTIFQHPPKSAKVQLIITITLALTLAAVSVIIIHDIDAVINLGLIP